MKKIYIMLIVLMALPVSGWAVFQAGAIAGPHDSGTPWPAFAFQVSGGMISGEAKEHVYDYEGPGGSRRQLSRLDWDLKNIVMGGVNGSIRMPDVWLWSRLTFNLGLWTALSEGNGEMDDYDWLDLDSSDHSHYSLSDVDVTQGVISDINFAWDIYEWKGLTPRALLGYKYNKWAWEDSTVFLLYPEDMGEPNYNYAGENGINYEQTFHMPYLGVNVDYAAPVPPFLQFLMGETLDVGLRTSYSPYMYAQDEDQHVHRDLLFKETFEGGDMLNIGLEVRRSWVLRPNIDMFASFAVDYQNIGLMVGDMVVENYATGERDEVDDIAGIENEYFGVSLSCGARF